MLLAISYAISDTEGIIYKHIEDGSVELYYNNSKKFETTSSGVVVTGICTATSFSGDGSGLSGVSGYNDLDNALFG
jgi:hypothetical protein